MLAQQGEHAMRIGPMTALTITNRLSQIVEAIENCLGCIDESPSSHDCSCCQDDLNKILKTARDLHKFFEARRHSTADTTDDDAPTGTIVPTGDGNYIIETE
jgi:hypothetical protein